MSAATSPVGTSADRKSYPDHFGAYDLKNWIAPDLAVVLISRIRTSGFPAGRTEMLSLR
ncbi:MAG: hypothetical protein O9342_10870 [Beijerinckiaceae bacterium]|nr:hypothetical protein [Beijerinckiaceae bacterium]